MPNKQEKKSQELKPVKLTAIDEYVLTVLKTQGEMYGLSILDCLNLDREKTLGSKLSFGSLYPALNRLEKKGLVEWRWGDDKEVSGGARRKYYKINALGLRSLEAIQKYRTNLMTKMLNSLGLIGG